MGYTRGYSRASPPGGWRRPTALSQSNYLESYSKIVQGIVYGMGLVAGIGGLVTLAITLMKWLR